MAEKISDNVGKKIVEALKMHDHSISEESFNKDSEESLPLTLNDTAIKNSYSDNNKLNNTELDSIMNNNETTLNVDSILQNAINQNLNNISLPDIQSDFEYPNNVAILNHLITKLPAGVTKQTGAVIIKQTMEALGIPMKSVIIEAQQVQDSLANRTKECQRNIIECRKQIATLEIKVQQYQKQAVVMNDIINLFMSTGV